MSVKIRSMQTGTASSYKGPTPLSHPLGACLERPGNSQGAAEGVSQRAGRGHRRLSSASACPAGLQSSHRPSGQCLLVPLPWGRVAQLPSVSLFHLVF